MAKIVENHLFMVRTTLLVHPNFYVEALDIVEATRKSKEIVDEYANDKIVVAIQTIDVPLIDLENVVGEK